MDWQNVLLLQGLTPDDIWGLKFVAILAIMMILGILLVLFGPDPSEPNDWDY